MIKQGIFLVVCVVSLLVRPATSVCHALALSGGGDRGAYEAGAMQGLISSLNGSEVTWDVVTGISTGSMNTLGLSIWNVGDEVSMIDWMLDLWRNMTADQVYEKWPLGMLQGLLAESGLFNSAPLRATIAKIVGDPPNIGNRKIVVGSSSLNTGTLHTWTEADKNDLIEAVMCSTAIPGVFPSQVFQNDTFSDGGDIIGVNVFDAVTRCQELVNSDEEIVVDIILTWADTFAPVDASKYKTLQVNQRDRALKSYQASMSAVNDAYITFPDVTWRYFITPQEAFPNADELNFDPTDLETMIQMGYNDSIAILDKYDAGLISPGAPLNPANGAEAVARRAQRLRGL